MLCQECNRRKGCK
ncbi:MAG: hypothetical protein L6U16_08570 [Porphyromonadaceae bacterium]|nr:MAG: hypothetical protein L6U16_08570 [Porphyromonadaceae bacterium]